MVKKPSPKPKKASKKSPARAAVKAAKHRDATPNLGDDYEAMKVRRMPRAAQSMAADAAAVAGWRVAMSLNKLLKQINAKAPARSKTSDGAIGDAAHRSRKSDHNPWVVDGGMGVVTARDFTHDSSHGCDCAKLAAALRQSRDPRVKYIIWNWQICWSIGREGSAAWAWRRYHGKNGHTHHLHLSVKPSKSLYDGETPWSLAGM